MSDSIKVAIKVRPLIKREREDNLPVQWVVQENSIVSTDSEMKRRGDGGFCFDHIFDMKANNWDVFETIVKPIVDAGVNGINGTVFAYGQTSSGKTYTMMGSTEEPGIIPLAIQHMFDAIAETAGREFLLRVSYLEIYNERVNDLLNKANTDLKIKEDTSGQVFLQCKEEITNCPENVLSIMKKGDKNRRIGETNMNERSSRSHTIFKITIESREAGADSDGAIQVSQLNLVDLAGSERARQTGATGERFKEGRHINMSLTTLGLVIMQLSEAQDGQKHVSFRDSKLTRLLQNSLGGNAMTAIICAVTPAALDETHCTLSFACRAKSVKNKPQINEVMSDAALLKRYARQLAKLQTELQKIKNDNRLAEVEEMESKLQEKDRINQLLEERIELLKTRIVSGDSANNEESFKCKAKRRQTWGGPGMVNKHLPLFQPKGNLPTIKETSFEKPRRKSIMQSVDITNQTFQTAFTDFELELFESERHRDNRDSDSDDDVFITKRRHRVTFEDDVFNIKRSHSPVMSLTPEKCNTSTQTANYQSPSTPKHVIRGCLRNLSKEYKELREFTILEKQLMCPPQVEEKLKELNLIEELNVECVITELCKRLKEAEEMNRSQNCANQRRVEQISELEKQIQNITSERNEFEYISCELRTELKQKTTELDLKKMSEDVIKQEEMKKISELEKIVENVTAEKNRFDRMNVELQNSSMKQIKELQQTIQYVTSERDEFEHMRREMHEKLNRKTLELEKLKNCPESMNLEMMENIDELKKRIDIVVSEKDAVQAVKQELETKIVEEQTAKLEAMKKISELEKKVNEISVDKTELERVNIELNRKASDLEGTIVSEQTAVQKAMEKVSELEQHIERITSDKNELERINVELTSTLNQKTADFESKIVSEQTTVQKAMEKVSELEENIERITSDKNELERINVELTSTLNQKTADFESKIVSEQTTVQKAMEKVSELEENIERITSDKNELERINVELTSTLNQKTADFESKIVSEQTTVQKAMEKVSELEENIERITSDKNELERINVELTSTLNQKTADFESRIVSEQTAVQKAIENVSELEKQIASLISDKSDLQCANEQLNEELNRKFVDAECKNNELQTLAQLEAQLLQVTSEKNEFERLNSELQAKLSEVSDDFECKIVSKQTEKEQAEEKIVELEKQIEVFVAERNEFQRARCELSADFDKLENLSKLEKQIENIMLEKNELERMVAELKAAKEKVTENTEIENQIVQMNVERKELEALSEKLQLVLNERISDFEARIKSEQIINQEAREKISQLEYINNECQLKIKSNELACQEAKGKIVDLEKQIENLTAERNDYERIHRELSAELDNRSSELERLKMIAASTNSGNLENVSKLEKQIENLTLEKHELEGLAKELKLMKEETTETVVELEKQIAQISAERKEFESANGKLEIDLNEKITDFESKIKSEQATNQEARERISQLEKEIESVTTEKNQLEQVASQLRKQLNKNMPESGDSSNSENTKISNLQNHIKGLQEMITVVQTENRDLKDQLNNQSILSCSRFNESTMDTSDVMVSMEVEKNNLKDDLQLKCQELDEIQNDVRSLKEDIENLQKTIYLLTTENMEMATKLNAQQENTNQAHLCLQKTIDELYTRISEVTNEKISLQSDLATLNEQLQSMRSKLPEDHSEDELLASYQCKIDKLTVENIELSDIITEKNKELESIKESKSLLFDHECMYKEKVVLLTEKNKSLMSENEELSTDLIDKIEENDTLKEQCDILKRKWEQSVITSETCAENNTEHLKAENNIFKTEIAELKTKLTILSDENAKLSNDLIEIMENVDSSRNANISNNTLHLSTIFNNTTESNQIAEEIAQEQNPEILANKVTELQGKVEHLTRLNKKLSDLKLTTCSQCAHLGNLNVSRRAIKLEVKLLNKKLEDLQRKFDQKCADTDILKSKINQDLNVSSRDSLNASFVDEMNVSFVEEKIQCLNDELEMLKAEHDKLNTLCEDKCNELEQLHSGINAKSQNEISTQKKGLYRNRIEQVQNHIHTLRNDIDELKKGSINFNDMINQYQNEKVSLMDEINTLRSTNEELREKISDTDSASIEKVNILENELTNMSKEIEIFSAREKEFGSQRVILEVELEGLKAEKEQKNVLIGQLNARVSSMENELGLAVSGRNELLTAGNKYKEEMEHLKKHCEQLDRERTESALKIQELKMVIENMQRNVVEQQCLRRELQEKGMHVEKLLQENEQAKCILMQKLQAAKTEMVDAKANLEIAYKNEFQSMSLEYERRMRESENNLQTLNNTLSKYVDENQNLMREIARFKDIEKKFNEKMLINDNEKINEELCDIRKCMMQELKSLNCNVNFAEFSNKPAKEMFMILLQTLISKEEEIIKAMQQASEKENMQSVDTEKRVTRWAKELETEIEILQNELTKRENAQKDYQDKISELEQLLRDSALEKDVLKEKIALLEVGLDNMQVEFDKQCKVDNQQEEAVFVARKREEDMRESFKAKEMELQSKMKSEKEAYDKKISDLLYTVESYKTKNLELNGTVEGLEANEKQLKNIIEANSIELKRNDQNMQKMNAEFQELFKVYNEMSQEMEQKSGHIDQVTAVLKNKCDTLADYQTKLETILPEYNMLKEHVKDQKSSIERHKEEIERLKKERQQQLEVIKDELNSEEIKNAGLTKQLHELNNKNVALIEELNELKQRYEELQEANAKLERKIRNSTSKIKAEADIEELKELNKRLQSSLDGASNKVAELHEAKNHTTKELLEWKGKHEFVLRENAKIKETLSSYESKCSTMMDSGQYDDLLQEKNRIALELEGKDLLLKQKDKELKECENQIKQLKDQNKEFDQELDEYAAMIKERDTEISNLENKLHSCSTENIIINNLEEKLKARSLENEKLRGKLEALQLRCEANVDQDEDVKLQNEKVIRKLTNTISDLQRKLNSYAEQSIRCNEGDKVHMDNSTASIKKLQNSFEGACNRVAELQVEKNLFAKELTDLSRDSVQKKKTLTMSRQDSLSLIKEEEQDKIILELENKKILLHQKDKELKDALNTVRDLTIKNKEIKARLEMYTATIRERDVEIMKLQSILRSNSMGNEPVENLREKLSALEEENRKLSMKIVEIQEKSRFGVNSERFSSREDYQRRQLKYEFDKSFSENEAKCQQLKRKINELELQLVSKNGKIATLELQIQSEDFPYQRRYKELEESLLAMRNKNAELSSMVRKLQRIVNDDNARECNVCRRWRVNRKDQGCQTIPSVSIGFSGFPSGVVEDYVKIQKLEKGNTLMKGLCRERSRRIKELEGRLKQLEPQDSSSIETSGGMFNQQ